MNMRVLTEAALADDNKVTKQAEINGIQMEEGQQQQ